jgi:protein ImuA
LGDEENRTYSEHMSCESPSLAALKQRLAGYVPAVPPTRFALGADPLDAVLCGGLQRARLHEIWPAEALDLPTATGFALMLAARTSETGGPIIWIAEEKGERHRGALYPPGLSELGIDPARILFVHTPDAQALLRAAGDVTRSPVAGAAVIVPAGPMPSLDLTATRRLTLFAEQSGVTALLLRVADPQAPSAAATRWRVRAASSTVLEANAPGAPAFTLDLLRQRGGAPSYGWRLEWDRDRAHFTSLSRPVAADAGGGYLATG